MQLPPLSFLLILSFTSTNFSRFPLSFLFNSSLLLSFFFLSLHQISLVFLSSLFNSYLLFSLLVSFFLLFSSFSCSTPPSSSYLFLFSFTSPNLSRFSLSSLLNSYLLFSLLGSFFLLFSSFFLVRPSTLLCFLSIALFLCSGFYYGSLTTARPQDKTLSHDHQFELLATLQVPLCCLR